VFRRIGPGPLHSRSPTVANVLEPASRLWELAAPVSSGIALAASAIASILEPCVLLARSVVRSFARRHRLAALSASRAAELTTKRTALLRHPRPQQSLNAQGPQPPARSCRPYLFLPSQPCRALRNAVPYGKTSALPRACSSSHWPSSLPRPAGSVITKSHPNSYR
jgi:hypothetical protein